MAAADLANNTFIDSVTSVTLSDGAAASLVLGLRQGFLAMSWTGRAVTESMNAGRRVADGILNETTDGVVTGSLSFLVQTWRGNTAHSPHDFVTNTGTAGSLTSKGSGGTAFRVGLVATYTADDGTTQTVTLAAVHFHTFNVSDAGDGKVQIEGQFTAYQNRPTFT